MEKIIAVAGYSKIKYIRKIKQDFIPKGYSLACIYEREPRTEAKQNYLKEFDVAIKLNELPGTEELKKISEAIECITCTQERDMVTYIKSLSLTKQITKTQEEKYQQVINKQFFKEIMRETNPQLVPEVNLVNEELLEISGNLTYPQVIKPTGLAGSTMIKIVHNADELVDHVSRFAPDMQKIANENYQKNISIIAEEYISGPQYSVNAYINKNGEVKFCPLIRVITPQELGTDDTYSAIQYNTEEVSPENISALQEAINIIVTKFQIKNTSAHFDCALTQQGWKFFEVGLRIGGNRQALFEKSHSFDHIINDVNNRLGNEVYLPQRLRTVSIVQTAATDTGTLNEIYYNRSVTGEEPPLISETKMSKIGIRVAPLCNGGGTVTRHFVIGKDENEVVKTSKQLYNDIKLNIE